MHTLTRGTVENAVWVTRNDKRVSIHCTHKQRDDQNCRVVSKNTVKCNSQVMQPVITTDNNNCRVNHQKMEGKDMLTDSTTVRCSQDSHQVSGIDRRNITKVRCKQVRPSEGKQAQNENKQDTIVQNFSKHGGNSFKLLYDVNASCDDKFINSIMFYVQVSDNAWNNPSISLALFPLQIQFFQWMKL